MYRTEPHPSPEGEGGAPFGSGGYVSEVTSEVVELPATNRKGSGRI